MSQAPTIVLIVTDPAGLRAALDEDTSYRVLDALRRLGPCNTWTVSDDLFGNLEHIHILHGPGESYAHLEHLERAGCVERDGKLYSLADGVAGQLAERDDGRWPLE